MIFLSDYHGKKLYKFNIIQLRRLKGFIKLPLCLKQYFVIFYCIR